FPEALSVHVLKDDNFLRRGHAAAIVAEAWTRPAFGQLPATAELAIRTSRATAPIACGIMPTWSLLPNTLDWRVAVDECRQGRRDCEKSITAEYLGQLEHSYERWPAEMSAHTRVHKILNLGLRLADGGAPLGDPTGSAELEEVIDILCRETGTAKARAASEA